jgi:hypothetical protein
MAMPKPIYGSFLFSVRITDGRFEYRFARCILLADVPLKQILDSPYTGQRVLRLRDGQTIRLRGISVADFANLTGIINALNAPPCGQDEPQREPIARGSTA